MDKVRGTKMKTQEKRKGEKPRERETKRNGEDGDTNRRVLSGVKSEKWTRCGEQRNKR